MPTYSCNSTIGRGKTFTVEQRPVRATKLVEREITLNRRTTAAGIQAIDNERVVGSNPVVGTIEMTNKEDAYNAR
jgi:hypothetical protein